MAQYLEMSDCEPAHTGSHKAWVKTRHICSLGYSVRLALRVTVDAGTDTAM